MCVIDYHSISENFISIALVFGKLLKKTERRDKLTAAPPPCTTALSVIIDAKKIQVTVVEREGSHHQDATTGTVKFFPSTIEVFEEISFAKNAKCFKSTPSGKLMC